MFKIGSTESYTWPVKILLPDNEGKALEQSFLATFRRVSQTEVEQIFDDVAAGKANDREIVKRVLIGWKNIVDEDGNQVPFSESLRDQVLDVAGVANQIGEVFLKSLKAGRVKN